MTDSLLPLDSNYMSSSETQLTIILDDETHKLIAKPDEIILDIALEAGIDAPYSCQGGVCTTCMAKVTEGKAEMLENTVLTDDEIAEGIVLTCQAQAKTATVTIDYDAV
jgi:ring-1,2-phenylacetyl-CoA epoxidase subunit PaaE